MDGRLPAFFVSRVRAAVGGYMVLLAVSGDEHFEYYPVAAWSLTLVAAGYAVVILLALRRPWRQRLRPWVPGALIGVDTGIITALAGVTGGAQSPFAPILLLVVIAVAIRFGMRRTAFALTWTVPALAVLILLVPQPERSADQRRRDAVWWAGHLTAGAVLAGVLSDRLDVARRRRAHAESEAELEHQRLELERLTRHRLEHLDAARLEFLSSLLHEFRPPVTSLATLSRALRRDEDSLSAGERAGMLSRMEGCAGHLDAVLHEVAEVLVAESLGAEHSRQQADVYLPQLAGQAAVMCGLPLEQLATRLEPGLTVVRADPDKLLRILAKLLEDATRCSPPGHVVEVEVGAGARAGQPSTVELAVLDRRLATSPWTRVRGPGEHPSLGLWVATRLAESMGGGVATEARAGGGLVVRAWFPVSPNGPEPRPSSSGRTVATGSGQGRG